MRALIDGIFKCLKSQQKFKVEIYQISSLFISYLPFL